MINFKPLELANQMYETLHQRYPEVKVLKPGGNSVALSIIWQGDAGRGTGLP